MRMLWRNRRHDRVGALLSSYIDGEVSASESRYVEEHLLGCDACAADLRSLRATTALLGSLATLSAPRSYALTAAQAEAARVPALHERIARVWRYGSAAKLAAAGAAMAIAVLLVGGIVGIMLQSPGGMSAPAAPAMAQLPAPAAAAPAAPAPMAAAPAAPQLPAPAAPAPAAPAAAAPAAAMQAPQAAMAPPAAPAPTMAPAAASAPEALPTAMPSIAMADMDTDTDEQGDTAAESDAPHDEAQEIAGMDTPVPSAAMAADATATITPTPEPTATATPTSEPTATATAMPPDTPTLEPTSTDAPMPEPTSTSTSAARATAAPEAAPPVAPTAAGDGAATVPAWLLLIGAAAIAGASSALITWARKRRR